MVHASFRPRCCCTPCKGMSGGLAQSCNIKSRLGLRARASFLGGGPPRIHRQGSVPQHAGGITSPACSAAFIINCQGASCSDMCGMLETWVRRRGPVAARGWLRFRPSVCVALEIIVATVSSAMREQRAGGGRRGIGPQQRCRGRNDHCEEPGGARQGLWWAIVQPSVGDRPRRRSRRRLPRLFVGALHSRRSGCIGSRTMAWCSARLAARRAICLYPGLLLGPSAHTSKA